MRTHGLRTAAIGLLLASGLPPVLQAADKPPPPGRAERKVETKRNSALLRLPANTWVHLKPQRNPAARSYSGVCYGAGLIFYFGGGHHSYPGNDVELYDVAEGKWTQATDPENWRDAHRWKHVSDADRKIIRGIGGGWGVPILSPKGRPLTEHTYQMHAWFPEEKAFYISLTSGMWAFDPVKRAWSKKCDRKNMPRGRDIHTWNLTYDPGLKTLVSIVVAGPGRGVFVFNRNTRTWSKRCAVPVSSWSGVYSTYDSKHRKHIVFGGRRWWTLDTAVGKTRFIASLADAVKTAGRLDTPPQLRSVCIEYDPRSTHTLVAVKVKNTQLWAYDAARNKWSEATMAGQRPTGNIAWDLLVYSPEHHCFLLPNIVGVQGALAKGLYAFRYVPSKPTK
ncbi:MAG: kelch repeat-containing protein [Phycisphaerae bacterium]|jgi:hypothetical protein|nr:kelch repeat-containing protein [Phycisphaerae bacterium]